MVPGRARIRAVIAGPIAGTGPLATLAGLSRAAAGVYKPRPFHHSVPSPSPEIKPPSMAQTAAASHGVEAERSDKHFWALTLGSVGVVYGDIGTSPLYALREAVTAAKHHGADMPEAVLGILSLIVWTLLLIVTLKYVLVLLNADNRGEGGTFALMALGQSVAKRSASLLLVLGVIGAAFFYGDAVLTPAISVLSAVEGLKLVAPQSEHTVVLLTIVILVGLFAVQSHGTAKV